MHLIYGIYWRIANFEFNGNEFLKEKLFTTMHTEQMGEQMKHTIFYIIKSFAVVVSLHCVFFCCNVASGIAFSLKNSKVTLHQIVNALYFVGKQIYYKHCNKRQCNYEHTKLLCVFSLRFSTICQQLSIARLFNT